VSAPHAVSAGARPLEHRSSPFVDRPSVIALAGGLREARIRRGISVRRLARLADLHPGVLSSYELGQRTPPDYVVALILGVLRAPPAECKQFLDLAARTHEHDLIVPAGGCDDFLRTTYEQRSTHMLEWSPTLIPEISSASPTGERPRYTHLVGEAAGGSPDAVINMTRHPHRRVRVVPSAGCAPDLLGPFTLYERDGTAFAVAAPHHQGSVFFTYEAAVTTFTRIAESLELHAVDSAAKS
jgi:transcriptional regulator with XRE-family HTH domain